MKSLGLLFFIFLGAFYVDALQKKHIESSSFSSATSSAYVRASDGAHVTANNIFEFADVLHDNGTVYIHLLLQKTIRNEHMDGREQTTGRIRVQAWTLGRSGTRRARWQFEAIGNSGEVLYQDRFFRVAEWGCCDGLSVYTYFSLLSGKKLYISNSKILSVSDSDGGYPNVRYIALGSSTPDKPMMLQYGTDRKVVQQLSLVAPRNELPHLFLATDNKPFIMANGEAQEAIILREPFEFFIVLQYSDGTQIRVPVHDDMMNPAEATIPPGYSFQ